MADEIGTIAVDVKEQGLDDALGEIDGASKKSGGGASLGAGAGSAGKGAVGGMLGSMLSVLTTLSTTVLAVLGVVAVIAGLLLSMEPIQQMLDGLFKIAQAFLAPLAQMLLKLFAPVLKFLVKLLPVWMEFMNNFQSMIENPLMLLFSPLMGILAGIAAVKTLFPDQFKKVRNVLQNGWNLLTTYLQNQVNELIALPGKIWNFVSKLPSMIWSFMSQLPQKIANKIADFIPGADVAGQAADTAGGLVDSATSAGSDLLDRGSNLANQLIDVNVSGYNDKEVRQILGRELNKK